jgi:ferrochelatase
MKMSKKALVLLNMGGPRDKTEFEMFLRNMFNDENILTIKNSLIRSMVASIIVLSRKNSAWENYEKIGGESPINKLTLMLIEKLQKRLPDIYITQAMRYTPPFSGKSVLELKEKNIEDVTLLPLYPQYSTTTTKSSLDDFIKNAEEEFNLKIIKPFFKDEKYNSAVVEKIEDAMSGTDEEEYNLIFSAHGLPQKVVDNGDPYEKEVNEHVDILKNMLINKGINFKSVSLAYQSKVGPMKWLEPSLESRLEELKEQKVLINPISFIIDNSETVFELDIEYKEIAESFGIKDYRVCRCVNDSDLFIEAIEGMI